MSKDTHTRSGDIVSMASKIIRCLLLLPLAAVLLPGNNGICDNWGCDAFQHHRYPATAKRTYSSGFDRDASRIRILNDAIGAATPNTNYFWSSSYKYRFRSSLLAAKESEDDDDDDEAEKIAKLKAEAEEKKASAEAEAKRLKAEAEKAAKLKAEQDKKLKEAQEMLAQIQAEAEARQKAEEETAKQQAEAEEKRKQAEEEAAKLKAEEEEKKRLKAKKKAEEEAAKQKAAEEEKQRLKAKKKADELATLMKAKEEAARVMAEIDAKLQAQTAEADEEEAERVQKLQADAEEKPELDDESDEMLKKMMEEMSKVQKELESRLEAEANQAAAKAKEEEEETSGDTADLADRLNSGAKYDQVAKTVEAEQVEKIPPPPSVKPKEGPIDTTASTAPKPTPDLSSKEKGASDEDDEKEDVSEPAQRNDPRTKGRSRKENLFDVIGRTASSGVTMDEITERKNKQAPPAPTPLPTEVMKELKKKGPPESFGQSVAASYRTNSQTKEESLRVMPDLTDVKELKKRGPPASFGSYAAAASSKDSPTSKDEKDTIDAGDKGPPASFGASVAMASSGEVPKDLLSRGTASTDASPPPQTQPKSQRKDNNIIDVVDVVYTKKDDKKDKQDSEAEKAMPVGSAPPLEVEKTVPQAPPLQVEKTVPPMKVTAEEKPPNPIKNIGKGAVENILGKKKPEPQEETKPKTEEKDDSPKEKGMEDRVAELLKEAFSLSKEDSRVADLLQGVVAITTGKGEKKSKEEKRSGKKVSLKGRKKAAPVSEEEGIDEDDDFDYEDEDYEDDYEDEDQDDYEDEYEDEEDDDFDDEDDEDEPVIMGGRNRRTDDRDDFGRKTNRGGSPNGGMGGNRFMEDTRRPGPFGDMGRDGYFEDTDDDYIEYDRNDRWRGRGPGAPRPGGPMQSGGYSVRPPSQSRGDMRSETDDDYYFLQFGSPPSRYDEPRGSRYDEPRGSRYDEPRGSGYYNDQDDYYNDDDDYDGAQPGAPRPAYKDSDDAPKGPPASFGSFVANASMDKTGYAPETMKDDKVGGSGINGGGGGRTGEEWGEEMSQPSGSMLSPRGVKVNGSGGKGGASKPLFVVSEDASDNGGRKKGPPSSFGKSVAQAGEQQTGFPTRSVEEEIANGGMATPTGSMATPKRKTPINPPEGSEAPNGSAGQQKKPLFDVSEEDSGPADFGSSVAEASGSKTGWAPKTPKRPTGGLEGGTLGGMRPKLKKKPSAKPTPEKKEFGDSVFDDCPPVESKKKTSANLPLSRKQSVETDLNQKHQRNPAVKLVDGGASKNPPKQVRFSGSMMAPRIRRKEQPAQPVAPPAEIEGDSLEEGEGKK